MQLRCSYNLRLLHIINEYTDLILKITYYFIYFITSFIILFISINCGYRLYFDDR